jgi:hypothetical protein
MKRTKFSRADLGCLNLTEAKHFHIFDQALLVQITDDTFFRATKIYPHDNRAFLHWGRTQTYTLERRLGTSYSAFIDWTQAEASPIGGLNGWKDINSMPPKNIFCTQTFTGAKEKLRSPIVTSTDEHLSPMLDTLLLRNPGGQRGGRSH